MIFWQTRKTTKQARPNVALPTARAHGQALEIVVDTGEKYAYSFSHQQATTTRHRLDAGDYAIVNDDEVIAAADGDAAALRERRDRGETVGVMGRGAAVLVSRLAEAGRIHGLLTVAGSGGSSVAGPG